jgi:hypothetical protein
LEIVYAAYDGFRGLKDDVFFSDSNGVFWEIIFVIENYSAQVGDTVLFGIYLQIDAVLGLRR